MNNIGQMKIDEIVAELAVAREKEKKIVAELDLLKNNISSLIEDIKGKFNAQISLDLNIKPSEKKSIPYRIVALIKENNGRFTSNDILNYFVSDGTYPNVESQRGTVPRAISILKSDGFIRQDQKGKPWFWIKDYD
jgi:hypothetical protein